MALPQSIRNAGEPWTTQELSKLEKLAAENFPPCVIGLQLGRPEDAILDQALRVGVKLTPLNRPPYGVLPLAGRGREREMFTPKPDGTGEKPS